MLFALTTSTPLIHTGDLYRMRKALEVNGRHCAMAWGVDAPTVEVFPERAVLPSWCVPVVFVDQGTDVGTLAEHFVLPTLLPACRVFVSKKTDLLSGETSASAGAGHEILETLIDPTCDAWRTTKFEGIQVALEVCDPVQTVYSVPTATEDVSVPNFVFPSWFGLEGEGMVDYVGELSQRGQLGPQGYAVYKSQFETWIENADGRAAKVNKPGAEHAWARTLRRIGAKP